MNSLGGGSLPPVQPLTIEFFARGLYTNRQPLYSALSPVGVSVIQFHDALIDGINIEVTDQFTLRRRPPFVKYCSQQLAASETVKQFYSVRDLAGNITVLADTNQRLLTVTPTALTSILSKGTTAQSFIQQVGDVTYIANGTDLKKWKNGTLSPWGIAAPTVAPTLNTGRFWKALVTHAINFAIEDPNGNIELLQSGGGSVSGALAPTWPTTLLSSTQDGGLTWVNFGPIGSWRASTAFIGPSVILDTNGNIQAVAGGGTSAASTPTWATTIGATTTDNTITWFNRGPGTALALSGYSWVYAYRTVDGNLSTASEASDNTGPILGPQRVNITAFSISAGVITFTGANNYVTGDVFHVKGLSNGFYLNGAAFTVLSTGLSTSVFEATLTTEQSNDAANAGQNTGSSISDSGYTLNVITTLTGEGTDNAQCNATATITNVEVLDNIATCLASNSFAPGIWITITGLSGDPISETLNNQQVQILTADSTQFTFQFNFADYGPSSDSGTATLNAVEIYRTLDGGGQYLFSGAVTNPPSTAYDSGAVIAGAGTGGSWTNPNNVTSNASYATIAVTEGSGAVNFTKVQGASGSAQYVAGGSGSPSEPVGTGADGGGIDNAWNSPNQITLDNEGNVLGDAAYVDLSNGGSSGTGRSNLLFATNFGFSLPSNTTSVDGISVAVRKRSNPSSFPVVDAAVSIVKGGVAVGPDHSSGALWPISSYDTVTYGGASDKWGQSWLYSDINASNFGFAIAAANYEDAATLAEVAHVTITVNYTIASSAPGSCTATFSVNVTSGNAILVCAHGRDGVPTITDNHSNSYTSIKTSGNMAVLACYAPAAGATTVTATFLGTNGGLLLIQEISGIISASQVDQSANSASSTSTGSVTTATANDAICTFLLADATPSFTVPSGYTSLGNVSIQESDSIYGIADAFKQVSSTGTSNPAWSISGTPLDGITVAFKVGILGVSGPLTANTFGLNVPFGSVDGIKCVFHAKTSSVAAPCTVSAQLLRNGQPIGNTKTTGNLTTGDVAYTFGANNDTWGLPWNYFNFNNSTFGVRFTVTVGTGTAGSYTFSLNDVTTEIFGTNRTWTYADATPDANLVEELIAPLAHVNDPPPGADGSTVTTGGTILAYWNGRMWMAVGNKVYFSGGPDILNGIPEECWPPGYFFSFPGNVTGLKVTPGGLLVSTSDTWWSILGGPQTVAFYPDQVLGHFGNLTPNCLAKDGDTIFVYTSSSQCFGVGTSGQTEVGFRIADLLAKGQATATATALAWAPSTTSIAVHRNGPDRGLWLSNGVGSLVRYSLTPGVENWSTIYQPLLSGSKQAGVVSSVETAAGVWTLLLSSNAAHDYIYARDTSEATFEDNGHAYGASLTIGNITITQPGQPLIPLHFISAYCARFGSVPTVSFLPNEIAAVGTAAFTTLPTAQNEPAYLGQTQSIMGRRWPVLANTSATPLHVRHCQVKVDFGSDAVPNELFVLSLKFDREQLT